MDAAEYEKTQIENYARYESLCARCGRCCGAYDGDPCAQLIKESEGRYRCGVYEDRLGPQRTASGRSFTCVPIQEVARFRPPYSGCPYVKKK